MTLLILTIAILVVGYLAFVYFFPKAIPDEKTEHTKHALKQIMEETQGSPGKSDQDSILKETFEEEGELVKGFYSMPLLSNLYPLIMQAGYERKTMFFAGLFVGLLFALLFVFLQIGLSIASLLVAPILAYMLLSMYLKRKVTKRNQAFINLFPDVLDMFVRGVKSGFPVTSAFKMVAENMEPPVSTEFEQVVNELAVGQTVSGALTRLAQRINEPDIHFFVVVMKVQQETGGNLAEVVSNLSNVIRKRKQLRLKIRAMTSEGRATSYILGSLPVFIFGALFVLQRDYLEPLWTTTIGMVLFALSGGLVVLCMVVVNQMVKIDI